MKATAGLVVLAGLLVAAESPTKKARQTDVKDFQGTWTAVQARGFGEKAVAEHITKLRLTIKGHDITARYGDRTVKGTFKLHATKVPQWIDVTVTDGPKEVQGKTFPGIYLLEGNNLLIAFRAPGKQRPEDFLKVDDKSVYQVQFRRQGTSSK